MSTLTTVAVFLIIYPMMVNVRFEAPRVLVLHLGGDAVGALAVIASALIVVAGRSPAADPAASLVIALLLALAGLRLLGRIVHLLAEGVPAGVPVEAASVALRAIRASARSTTSTCGRSPRTCRSSPPTSRQRSGPTCAGRCSTPPRRSGGSA